MKKLLSMLLVLAAVLALATSSALAADVALVTDVGTIDDESFNQACWQGVEAFATAQGLSYQYYQPSAGSTDERLNSIDQAVTDGAKVVVMPCCLFGAAAAVSFVLQILFAELVSRLKRRTMYTVGIASAIVMAACSAAVLSDMTALAIGCYFIACSLLQALPGIGNTIGMEAIEAGSPTAYSVARGMGSLGYSIFAYVTGLLVASLGIRMVSYLGLVVSAIMLAGLFLYSSEIRAGSAASVTKEARSGGFFRQNKAFFIFLIGAVFLCINHNLITCFLYRIMLFKQGTAADQGLAAGISAIVEVPIMFLFPYIAKRIPCKALVCGKIPLLLYSQHARRNVRRKCASNL